MSVFGFIENFFFVSLALVFVLVIFLVYHFKNRITVAEKKNESMYGLLTAVVKEIKTLRGMFGLGGTVSEPTIEFSSQTKTTPEVNVIVMSDAPIENDLRPISISLRDSELSTGTGLFVSERPSVCSPTHNQPTFLKYVDNVANKIVVSDEDSDSDSDSEEFSDVEEDESTSDEDEEEEEETHYGQLQLHSNMELDVSELSADEIPISHVENDNHSCIAEEQEPVIETFPTDNSLELESQGLSSSEQQEDTDDNQLIVENIIDLSSIVPQIPSLDQLRKMNINQLKTIASQIGITTDASKMKKPELISLIREGGV